MQKLISTFILIIAVAIAMRASNPDLSTVLKEDFFKEMIFRKSADSEMRLRWYDSLLNVSGPDREIDIHLEKIGLMRECGYTEAALMIADSLLEKGSSIPLHQRLPLLSIRAYCLASNRDLLKSIVAYRDLLDMPKPDSLKYWDIKVGFGLFSIYEDLGDITQAAEWLRKIEGMMDSYRLTPEFRQDVASRLHGSKAVQLIFMNQLDSAYKEVKKVRELAIKDQVRMGALMQIAQIYLAKGQTQAAIQYAGQALEMDVDGELRRTAIYLMASCLLQERKFAEALHILDSYQRATIKVNQMGNQRFYHRLRGNAYAGTGDFKSAYSSMDSALTVGDTLMAKMTKFQSLNAENYIRSEKELSEAHSAVKSLSAWMCVLALCLLLAGGAVIPLLLRNRRIRKELERQRSLVSQARIDVHNSVISEARRQEDEDLSNRRQTALLLKMAHFESVLGALRKKLEQGELDDKERNAMLRQLKEISGKEKMWDLFSMQFELVNRKFLSLLNERHPDLSKSEKRLCAFMLMNLKTKEIAEILECSPRTVDVTKYNIRKKLAVDIPTEQYLQNLSEEASRQCTKSDAEAL